MERILWGRNTSSNVMKVIWLLEELGLPYRRIDVGGAFGKTDTPEYRAMNPVGLVPTLQEGDFTLWESNAVLRYLAAGHAAGTAFWPTGLQARANIDRWMDAQQTVLNRPMSVVFWTLVRTPAEKRDAAGLAKGIEEASRAWGLIEAQLAHHPYLTGELPSLADIPWGVHVHRWFSMEFDRPAMPRLRAWYDRLLSRPAYQAHIARPLE